MQGQLDQEERKSQQLVTNLERAQAKLTELQEQQQQQGLASKKARPGKKLVRTVSYRLRATRIPY